MGMRVVFRGRAKFLSTPSARRATVHRQRHGRCDDISIHALREEGDAGRNSRLAGGKAFLSTPSARRATPCRTSVRRWWWISIHALREEGDRDRQGKDDPDDGNFYPRPPRGGRPGKQDLLKYSYGISIHALREEGDASPSESS